VSTGEHFIARTCSPVITFAGGEFLDTSEDLLQLPKEDLVSHLRKLDQADVEAKIIAHIQVAGMRGIAKLTLAERATASGSQVDAVLEKSNAVSIDNTIAIDRSAFDGLCDKAIGALKDFHEKNPTATGQSLDIFRAECLDWSPTEIVDYVTGHLADTKQVEVIGNTVRLSEFNRDDNIDPSDREAINTIEQVFRDGGAATPFLDEVLGDDPSRKRAYQYLKDSGRLIALKDHGGTRFFVFHQETIEAIKKQLAETYPPPSNFTVSDFRVLTGSTRKYVIPMLEYFDRNRITIRQGNNRSLSRIEN